MLNKKSILSTVAACMLILGLLFSFVIGGDVGATIFALAIFIGGFAFLVSVRQEPEKIINPEVGQHVLNPVHYDITYIFFKQFKFPYGSAIVTFISFVWFLLTDAQSSDRDTALAIFILFFLASAGEFIIKWLRTIEFNNCKYLLNSEGVLVVAPGSNKQFFWKDYDSFSTKHSSWIADVFSLIPFSGFVINEATKMKIRLHRSEKYLQTLKRNPQNNKSHLVWSDEIIAPIEKMESVVAYIAKHLPLR